jgi:hypothetical protein
MAITTAMCASFKKELMQGAHCFTAQLSRTGDVVSGNQTIGNVNSIADLCRGMPISGAGIPAAAFIENIPTATSITVSRTPTAGATGVALTIKGDDMKMALIKASPTGAYGAASTNYSQIVANSDEASGAGYTAGGMLLSNVTPSLSGNTAITNFSPNPTWVSATFSTNGCMIYNSSTRGGVAGRAISCHDFAGTQSVTSGTFTVVMPAVDANNAILRIG